MKKIKVCAMLTTLGMLAPAPAIAGLLSTTLKASEEVPGPGDEDGSGNAVLVLKPHRNEACFILSVEDIEAATAAHVHKAPFGSQGPVVITLTAPSEGSSFGCIEDVERELLLDIKKNPQEYYINVHNEEFPAGALRGQLGDHKSENEK